MTNQITVRNLMPEEGIVLSGIEVKLVLPTGERVFDLAEVLDRGDDPMRLSDDVLKQRVATYIEPTPDLSRHQVFRPTPTSIMIQPKAVYG